MRIGLLRTQVPFVTGGAERHSANLCAQLQAYGHEATEITVPFKWYPGEVLADHILAARMLDLSEVGGVPTDMLIGLKFPAYLVPHPNKLFWVIHQHRSAYDQWELGNSDLLHDPDGIALKHLIHEEDRAAFAASPHPIYANSGNVATRLHKHLGIESTALYHPPPNAELLQTVGYGDYLFAPGRINPTKRLDLMLEALAHSKGTKLVIAGVAENPEYQQQLIKLAERLGVSKQVEWLGPVDDATLLRHYAEARAVVFTPQDEDYGYISLEAMLAAKPVITVSDSGGPLEFIRHDQEGLITQPNGRDLGRAFEMLSEDSALAERMGAAGKARYEALDITWQRVVETFTGTTSIAAQALGPIAPQVSAPTVQNVDPSVAQLSKAIALPAISESFPFGSVADVMSAYDFGTSAHNQTVTSDLEAHWARSMVVLSALDDLPMRPKKVLYPCASKTFLPQTLMAQRFTDIQQSMLCQKSCGAHVVSSRKSGYFDVQVSLEQDDAALHTLPWADDSFDLVMADEGFGLLNSHPREAFADMLRVLRPGGYVVLTVPNLVSHCNMTQMLASPDELGAGYAPTMLSRYGAATGFEAPVMRSVDVSGALIDSDVAKLLVGRGDDLTLRGEILLYLARKPLAQGTLND